jgi:hypothetical protein
MARNQTFIVDAVSNVKNRSTGIAYSMAGGEVMPTKMSTPL